MHRPRRAFGGSFADLDLKNTTGSISFKMTIFAHLCIGLFVENRVWGEVGGYGEFQSVCLDMGVFSGLCGRFVGFRSVLFGLRGFEE